MEDKFCKYTHPGLEAKVDSLESKVDNIAATMKQIEHILDRNTTYLDQHMRRTELNELSVDKLDKGLSKHLTQTETLIKLIAYPGVIGLIGWVVVKVLTGLGYL